MNKENTPQEQETDFIEIIPDDFIIDGKEFVNMFKELDKVGNISNNTTQTATSTPESSTTETPIQKPIKSVMKSNNKGRITKEISDTYNRRRKYKNNPNVIPTVSPEVWVEKNFLRFSDYYRYLNG